jgi:hypothetical protein
VGVGAQLYSELVPTTAYCSGTPEGQEGLLIGLELFSEGLRNSAICGDVGWWVVRRANSNCLGEYSLLSHSNVDDGGGGALFALPRKRDETEPGATSRPLNCSCISEEDARVDELTHWRGFLPGDSGCRGMIEPRMADLAARNAASP